jgi:hypothetical protein
MSEESPMVFGLIGYGLPDGEAVGVFGGLHAHQGIPRRER